MLRSSLIAVLAASTALTACTMAPVYHRPGLPVGQSWPVDAPAVAGPVAADLGWREVFLDPKLQAVIDLALTQNRDLRVAVGNIERARAQYRIQRAELLPAIGAGLSGSRAHTPASASGTGQAFTSENYTATVGFSAYELDLFGRVRSLNAAALQSFFAADENRRAVQISLVAEVAGNYLTLAADQDLLAIVQDTLKSREAGLDLSRKRFNAGAISGLELSQAETLREQARSDAAALAAQVVQDRNALQLVTGAEIPAALLPNGGLADIRIRGDLQPGLPSDVLVRRPDVAAAEHQLQAQNANIGAARAAFFPRISLTGATGTTSSDLDGLFKAGTGVWSFTPQILLPIFNGGANLANLRGARANRDIAIAQYERAIQAAFRDVADALAVRATIRERLGAQQRLAAAAGDTQRLTDARYTRGVDSYLSLLDAQRTFYAARQSLLATQLVEALNSVELYRAVGGGTKP